VEAAGAWQLGGAGVLQAVELAATTTVQGRLLPWKLTSTMLALQTHSFMHTKSFGPM
jgi:hypothetical protein